MGEFRLSAERRDDRVRLILTSHRAAPVSGFRLAVAGPARIDESHTIENGTLAHQRSTYAELAPPSGFTLSPGDSWTVDIIGLERGMHHWTDGPAAGFVILADDTAVAADLEPTARAGALPYRRGTTTLEGEATLAILPWPNGTNVSGSRSVPTGLAIDGFHAAAVTDAFAELTKILFPNEQFISTDKNAVLVLTREDATLAGEAYRINFAEDIELTASGDRGLLYGLVTLAQILRGARRDPSRYVFPASGTIEDAPHSSFRGCHLDVARRFYPVADIKRFLAILAWNKLNVFHWHLSDDEAWRVEIDAYPALTAIGAWRGHGLPLEPFLGTGPALAGGVYTKVEVAAIVALAERFGIEVIPEVDIPGHNHAMLTALPALRDPGETGTYYSIQHFPNNCLNPGVEAVYATLEAILSEMAEMFPSPRFHVGADEVPKDAWSGSPAAAALNERLGTSGSAPLQAHFLRRIQEMLKAKGKVTGAWEEAAHGGGIDAAGSYLVGWTRTEISRQLAAEGYDVVVAPGQAYYLDMAMTPEWHEPGANWAGSSTPEATYGYDPVAGWTAEEAAHFIGVQGCIWSEPMISRDVFDRLVFPRLSAIAETGWTTPANKDFSRFAAVSNLMPNLYGHREE